MWTIRQNWAISKLKTWISNGAPGGREPIDEMVEIMDLMDHSCLFTKKAMKILAKALPLQGRFAIVANTAWAYQVLKDRYSRRQ